MREDPERKRTEDHMGESWHNNHHAFPGAAKLGLILAKSISASH